MKTMNYHHIKIYGSNKMSTGDSPQWTSCVKAIKRLSKNDNKSVAKNKNYIYNFFESGFNIRNLYLIFVIRTKIGINSSICKPEKIKKSNDERGKFK